MGLVSVRAGADQPGEEQSAALTAHEGARSDPADLFRHGLHHRVPVHHQCT